MKSENSDIGFLENELLKLKEALTNMDIKETDLILNEIGTKTWNAEIDDMMEKISTSILMLEYDAAFEIISSFILNIKN